MDFGRMESPPDHELILKVGDISLATRAINGLELANNSWVCIIAIHRYFVEVLTVGDCAEQNVRIPHISFKFRLPYGKSYQLTRLQLTLHLAYAMTYNKNQSQTLFKVLLNITSPPFSHGQLYVALSRVRDCKNIVMYLNEEQLTMSSDSRLMDFMPTVNKGLTKRTLCGIVLFKLNTFLVMFLRIPSIDSTCFPHT
jgi:hypothetical protein